MEYSSTHDEHLEPQKIRERMGHDVSCRISPPPPKLQLVVVVYQVKERIHIISFFRPLFFQLFMVCTLLFSYDSNNDDGSSHYQKDDDDDDEWHFRFHRFFSLSPSLFSEMFQDSKEKMMTE